MHTSDKGHRLVNGSLTAFLTKFQSGSRISKLGTLIEAGCDGVILRIDYLIREDATSGRFSVRTEDVSFVVGVREHESLLYATLIRPAAWKPSFGDGRDRYDSHTGGCCIHLHPLSH